MRDYRHLQWSFSSNSSGGQYLKSEEIVDHKKIYYKLSDYGYQGFRSHEAVLEVIASRLGRFLGLPVLKYTGEMALITLDGKEQSVFVTRSENYCKAGQTAMSLLTDYKLNHMSDESPLAYCQRIGLTNYIDAVLLFDYLIMNVDRHGRNIELLYDAAGNMTPAPIFDNGRCLTFACGNQPANIAKWDYTEGGMGNNFVGGVYLEQNLKHISKPYALPRLDEKAYASIFYRLGKVLSKEHISILRTGLDYRYQVLLEKGVIR